MKTIFAILLAGACASALAAGQAASTYRATMNKAESDYKVAKAKCDASSGHAKDLCVDQAKLERAQAEADAAATYPNSDRTRQKARIAVADAEHRLARTRCADQSGDARDSCLATAKAAHTTAVADARTGRSSTTAATSKDSDRNERSTSGTGSDRNDRSTAATAGTSGAVNNTGADRDTGSMADRSRDAAQRTGDTVADSMITTRVKADMFREPNLKAGDIHVETVQGVVMLSGFVNNKSEAERAVEVARSVKGVQDVKSSIKVK